MASGVLDTPGAFPYHTHAMTAYPYASSTKISDTLALIGETQLGDNTINLLTQLCIALANRNAGGGDPGQNTVDALGGVPLATNEIGLLTQAVVLAATA